MFHRYYMHSDIFNMFYQFSSDTVGSPTTIASLVSSVSPTVFAIEFFNDVPGPNKLNYLLTFASTIAPSSRRTCPRASPTPFTHVLFWYVNRYRKIASRIRTCCTSAFANFELHRYSRVEY